MIPKSKTRKYLAADDKYKDISPLNIINYVNSYSTGAACPTCDTTNEKELIELALNKQTMIVFAAGNEGMVSPNIQSMLPRYDESLRSWITVGAFNPAYVTKSRDGSLNFESNKALSDFSNGFYGAESWGILAPGEDIYS
ncbi:MAG: S8 family serine peptidase, partial [Helicobacter sp.]|nr:S8 family serine peptidase [Helicobacter sp.]